MNRRRKTGFTLIELLIVIGLLAALTALVLPSLSADRSEAMAGINQYNKAGTARAMYEYHDLFGEYPNDMHTGLSENSSSASAMPGFPKPMKAKAIASRTTLDANEVESLSAAGITSVCYGDGLNSQTLAAGTSYVIETTDWSIGRSTTPMTFNGMSTYELLAQYLGGTAEDSDSDGTPDAYDGNGRIIALYITPTTDWSSDSSSDWSKGAVELGISLDGQVPMPTVAVDDSSDVDFAYYAAHFIVDGTGEKPAKLVGITCSGGGALNP